MLSREDVVRIGKLFHAACLGKVICVPGLLCYGKDDNSHDLEGPFYVRVDASGVLGDLEEFQCGHYDPNWSVTPLPGQGIEEGMRTFWCTPVSYEFATEKWHTSFTLVDAPVKSELKRYRVTMSGLALMQGSIEVEAANEEDASAKARTMSGDVSWSYEGMSDDTIEVNYVEEKQ